jgi:ATP-binding cassette subfamily B protein
MPGSEPWSAAYHPRSTTTVGHHLSPTTGTDTVTRFACVRQQDQKDCGAAALATVARHHGLSIGIGRIREAVGTDRAGTTLLGLAKGADALGFAAKGAKGDWDGLAQVPLPAICHTVNAERFGHFVVVHRVRGDRVTIADPASGLVELDRQRFTAMWSGYCLLLTARSLRPEPAGISRWAFIREVLRPHHGVLTGALACSLVMTALGLGNAFFIRHLVDHVLIHGQTRLLDVALVGMVALLLFRCAFDVIRGYLLSDVGRKIDLTLIACYLRHVMHMPMRFFETRRVGEILSRANDAMKIRQLVSTTALGSIVDGGMIALVIVIMLAVDWRMALVAIVFVPTLLGLVWLVRRPLARRQRELMERAADLDGRMVEDLTAIETIKTFAVEQPRLQGAETKLVGMARTLLSSSVFALSVQGITAALMGLAALAVLGVGGHRVIAGEMTIGGLMFFNTLTAYLYGPLERLAGVMVNLQDAAIALDRLWDVLSLELESAKAPPKPARVSAIRRGIRIAGVSFRYGQREEVLRDVDLVIPAGKTVAIVGESGCGKSTICKLLAKHYEPVTGSITVDGVDLRDIDTRSWRRRLGYVPQDTHVLSGTIAENIALGRPRASRGRIERTARLAGLAEVIERMPDRYATLVGERGMALSGGQRQRLAIARAILVDPRLCIFDEATSHLDTRTERAIQATLRTALRGRTALIVAHRLSTIQHTDLIYVLDGGRVLESGSHDDLMRLRGGYWSLWRAQQQAALEGVDADQRPEASVAHECDDADDLIVIPCDEE